MTFRGRYWYCDGCNLEGPSPDVAPPGWFTIAVYRLNEDRIPHSKHLCGKCAVSPDTAATIGAAVVAACGQQPQRVHRVAPASMRQMREKTVAPRKEESSDE